MSNIFGGPKAGAPGGADESRAVPKGDTVGSYNSYLDAQKAVDYLADQQFPVQLVSIVGNDLKMVERVTGRLTYPRVALSGALSGMWFGLFVGVMLSFFSTSDGYFSIVTSVLMGAAFFMLFGIVTYAMQRGKRDFTSTNQVVATNYDVVVAFEAAHEARRLLHQLPMTQHDASAPGYQQFDHQHQPYQQGPQQPGQPGQGPAPQRPAGWSDPYGQRASDAAPQQRAAGEPVAQEPARPSGVSYPDLPDGRPQYGVRVTDAQRGPAPQGITQQGPAQPENRGEPRGDSEQR
ncbi:ECF transporter S component [Arthrobacter sp. UKPF54-2]|uniref:general stress protein n=1 Tax=Arthrobacter sp. UKPF54-2 TaxID=2600159 RepID=UPI0011B114F9|nr:general stress protein [Arthrobacter sp. UKPF54-2]QDY90551.1 ECF transporter S component [Arthrobacter sp. UKPF54-2]